MAQRNYLNNKDLLKQIHLSKQTYCAYTHDKFKDYDLIVAEHVNCIDIEDLTDENKEEAITNRKKRLQIDKDIEVDDLQTLLDGLRLVGDYLDKTILRPNNLSHPLNRVQFLNTLK